MTDYRPSADAVVAWVDVLRALWTPAKRSAAARVSRNTHPAVGGEGAAIDALLSVPDALRAAPKDSSAWANVQEALSEVVRSELGDEHAPTAEDAYLGCSLIALFVAGHGWAMEDRVVHGMLAAAHYALFAGDGRTCAALVAALRGWPNGFCRGMPPCGGATARNETPRALAALLENGGGGDRKRTVSRAFEVARLLSHFEVPSALPWRLLGAIAMRDWK